MPTRQRVAAPLTVQQRVERGKAARAAVPRSSHAVYEPPTTRPDPVSLLEGQAASRVPELVPIRYGRMSESALSFYRGGALIMANDLAHSPTSGITAQLCGDAHLSNFGVYASPERRLVFDLNDFDETLPGPWEWDVKRLLASLAIAGRHNSYPAKLRRKVVLASARRYREAMRTFAAKSNLEVWHARIDADDLVPMIANKTLAARASKNLVKARSRGNEQALDKLTAIVDGERRFASAPPLVVPMSELVPDVQREELVQWFRSLLRSYQRTVSFDRRSLLRQFDFVDVARKVVGVGSVGTRAWAILLFGRDQSDPLFLQAKEAQPSVLAEFAGKSVHNNQGERVVTGQRLMQAASDIFLGWERVTGLDGQVRDFYVRQLRDWKGSAIIEGMVPEGMLAYGEICGWTLARAHARSGDRIAIAEYLGSGDSFDQAVADYAEAYADQSERDHLAMLTAIENGRLTAERGI